MTISKLIEDLMHIREQHGDLRIYVREFDGYEEELESEDIDLLYPRHKEQTWKQDRDQAPFGVMMEK